MPFSEFSSSMLHYRFLIPVALFVAFAGAHRLSVTSQKTILTAAARDLPEGHRLESNDLIPLPISSPQADRLTQTFIRYQERGSEVLFDRLTRPIRQGELIALRDLESTARPAPSLSPEEVGVQISLEHVDFAAGQLYVGMSVGFLLESTSPGQPTVSEVVSPFRVVGIGDIVNERSLSRDTDRSSRRILTIAVRKEPENPSQLTSVGLRLIRAASDDPQRPERIRALVILPKTVAAATGSTTTTSQP
jgi:hypothetical protein